MSQLRFLLILILCQVFSATLAETADERYRSYISNYSEMAVEQQKKYGIPASITLAQGLLESAAGRSTLAREGNNHFGIKCHRDWQGETMLRDDDAPDECFRVYKSVAESFHDHSIFLTGRRYRSLFELDVTDYASWAGGLSKCGYATDPNYASRLIAIIERYSLYEFDSGNYHHDDVVDYIRDQLAKTHPVLRSRGLHFVVALPGDTYSALASEFKISKKKLMKFNDSDSDQIREWQEVYLQEKLDVAPEGLSRATIGEDESLHSLSQRFGMKLSVIRKLNPGVRDEVGTSVRLR